jgi:GH3 auxin-responsive promoter
MIYYVGLRLFFQKIMNLQIEVRMSVDHKNWANKRDSVMAKCSTYHDQLQKACFAPRETLSQMLADCVIRHTDTAFGRQHGFRHIKTLKDYRHAVPIHRYDDLNPWIQRILTGENHVLTIDDPYMMLKTSGTTGPSKAIPQTQHWRFGFRGPIIYALWGLYAKYFPQIFDHPHATLDFLWEREEPKEFLGKLPHQAITNREISLGGSDWSPPWYAEPWVDFTNDSSSLTERNYLRIRHFIGQDLRAIATIQPNRLLTIAETLGNQAQRLIEDVHNGELWGKPCFEPNPRLAANLESLVKTEGRLLPKSVWPNLNLLACWKSKMLNLYLDELPKLYPDTEIMPLLTGATEAVITCPIDRHSDAGVLAFNQGIYEFIHQDEANPQADENDAETLSYDQLTVGKTYSLVITQANGLYRYAIGDLYKVVDYYGQVPRLDFVRRQGIYSSFNGEKLNESQVMDAFQAARDQLDLPSGIYACCPVWAKPPYYTFIVEVGSDWPSQRLDQLAGKIDIQLSRHNSEYHERIKAGWLGPAVVKKVRSGTFQAYWDSKVAKGSCAPQLKHHFCQKDSSLLEELEAISATSL